MRQSIELSSCRLSLRHDPLRLPTRQFSLRSPDFEDEYDFTTLFNDVFWSEDGTHLILIGPPLLNLLDELAARFVALPQGIECRPKHERKLWMDQISLPVPAGTTGLAIEGMTVRFVVAPQPSLCSLFAGRRVIFAQSKNNSLAWIRDWARFYAREHGCDGVIVYDNNSDRYGLDEIDAALDSADAGLQVAVVGWPFPYGVFDGRRELSYTLWDSFYSQATIFEHARRRLLARASSVINADIDELSLCEDAGSICDVVERSETGMVRYCGWWIENESDGEHAGRRHRDYVMRRRGRLERTDYKWAVVPARCHDQAQWCTHNVFGMQPDATSAGIHLRHFRAINTNWDVHGLLSNEARTTSFAGRREDLEVDTPLREALGRVFADVGTSEPIPTHERPDPVKAHGLRVLAGRAQAEGAPDRALDLAAEACRLLPDHPGLKIYLAGLLDAQGQSEEPEALRAEAHQLTQRSPAYYLQMGRACLARGATSEGLEHLHKAVALDAGFVEAWELLVANSGSEAGEALRREAGAWLRTATTQDSRALAAAAGLCRQAGLLAEGLEAIERAIAIAPHWSCHQLRAQILATQGDAAGAIVAWRDAIASAARSRAPRPYPDHECDRILPMRLGAELLPALQHASLSTLLLAEGRAAEALEAAVDGLEADPGSPRLWLLRAEALERDGRHDEADAARARCRDLLTRALDEARIFKLPNSEVIRSIELLVKAGGRQEAAVAVASARHAGITSWKLERIAANIAVESTDTHEAAACLRRAIALRPGETSLYNQFARLLMNAKMWSDAAAVWKDLIAVAPQNASAHAQLATTLSRFDALEEAVAAMQRAIALKGDVAEWQLNLGLLLFHQHDWSAGAAAAQRAIDLDPHQARAYRVLYEALDGQGRGEEALDAIGRAIDLDDGVAQWHYDMAALLARQQQWPDAAVACEKAIELVPAMTRAQRLLEECRRHQ